MTPRPSAPRTEARRAWLRAAGALSFGRAWRAAAVASLGSVGAQSRAQTADSVPRATASPSGTEAAFAARAPGDPIPDLWQAKGVGSIPQNQVRLEASEFGTVLRIDSHRSASSLVRRFEPPMRLERLAWRWRTDAWPSGVGPAGEKAGDDFSLRLYVMFDYPIGKVPLGERWLLRIARTLYDPHLPAATLCYVADHRLAAGSVLVSPYTGRVQMMALRQEAQPGAWWSEDRDLRADFQRAFGAEHGPGLPPVAALALAADTDQGGGRVRAWFSDPRWSAAR